MLYILTKGNAGVEGISSPIFHVFIILVRSFLSYAAIRGTGPITFSMSGQTPKKPSISTVRACGDMDVRE